MAVSWAFLGILRNQFASDDWELIRQTVGFRGFDARHLLWMLTTTRLANSTPLAWLSYAIDYAIWGLNPVGYHLTNLLLHALNAVLLQRLAARLLGRIFPAARPAELALGALIAALTFGLSPLRAESVAWASERRDVLAGAFYLSSILFYVRFTEDRNLGPRRGDYALSLVFYTGAALTKATVVPLPLALLALDVYPLRRLGAAETSLERRERLIEKLPYLALAVLAALLALRAQWTSGNLVALSEHSPSARLAQALFGLGFYVRKTVLPTGLHALYPLGHPRLLSRPTLTGLATLAAAAGLCATAGVTRRAQAVLWIYYAALLLPVLGLLQNGPQLVALRYSYLSCMGWAVLVGATATAAARLRSKYPARGAAALAALIVWLAAGTWALQHQIALWHDDRTLWGDVLVRYPLSADANANFAAALLRDKDFSGAENRARFALTLDAANTSANFTLAKALLAQNRPTEARTALAQGLKFNPVWAGGEALLGLALNADGRIDEALTHLQRAAELLPDSAQAQGNVGAVLALRGRYDQALPYFEQAARLDPAYAGQLEHLRHDLAGPHPR